MLKPLSIVALAVVVLLPGIAGAQPLDPYGRPYVTSPPQPSPGDPQMSPRGAQPMPIQSQGVPMYGAPSQAMAPAESGGGTMRDEYGNRYNSRGDRIDGSGRIIPPPVTPPAARALR